MYDEVKGYLPAVYDKDGHVSLPALPITKDLLALPKEEYQIPYIEFFEIEKFISNYVPPHSWHSPPRSPLTVDEIEVLYHNMVLLASLFSDDVFPEVPTRDSCRELKKVLGKHGMIE